MNENCPICHAPISEDREALFLHTVGGVMMNGAAIVVDDTLYCGICAEAGIKMMLEGRRSILSEITEAEGIERGTRINRPADITGLLKQGNQPGHTTFRANYEQKEWLVSDHGIVCFCTVLIRQNWTYFKVITVPKKGMFVHVEPNYD